MPETGITIYIEGRERRVDRNAYITAKTKQLREFGYPDLKRETVEKQVDLLLSGKKWTDVIGAFCERDFKK